MALRSSRSAAVSHHKQWSAVWVVSTPPSHPHLQALLRGTPAHSGAQGALERWPDAIITRCTSTPASGWWLACLSSDLDFV